MAEGTLTAQDANGPGFRESVAMASALVALAAFVQLCLVLLGLDPAAFGVFPRRAAGLLGIVFAPLVHASFAHLVANALPLLVIGTALLYGYPRSAKRVLAILYLGTGTGVWLFARAAPHVGASGLASGMMLFVFTAGILRRDRRAAALSMLVFFLHGGMLWGIFPSDPRVSYESHFFGALLGVVLAVALRHAEPPPPEKRYDWEDEEGEAEADSPGDPSPGDTADADALRPLSAGSCRPRRSRAACLMVATHSRATAETQARRPFPPARLPVVSGPRPRRRPAARG